MKIKRWIIGLNFLLFASYFIYNVLDKEEVLKQGEKVLLKLAPVDPRSLIQGDYMRLNYAMNREIRNLEDSLGSYLVLRIDTLNRGEFIRVQKGLTPRSENEVVLKFKRNVNNQIKIGAESYLFQEGKAELLEHAEYGCLRIDKDGNSVLVGLYSEDVKLIE